MPPLAAPHRTRPSAHTINSTSQLSESYLIFLHRHSTLKFQGWGLTEYSGVLAVDNDLCFFDSNTDGRRAMNITSFMAAALAALEDNQQKADILAVAEDRVRTKSCNRRYYCVRLRSTGRRWYLKTFS